MKRQLTYGLMIASLLCLPFAIGCSGNGGDEGGGVQDGTHAEGTAPAAQVHSHEGRHGGLVAVLGSHQYHAEAVPSEESGTVKVYVMDYEFKPIKPKEAVIRINAAIEGMPPKQYIPNRLETAEGTPPAEFLLEDPQLAEILSDGWEGTVKISADLDGTTVEGELAKPKAGGHEHHDAHESDGVGHMEATGETHGE